jgi:hypothetical protein
VGRANRRRGSPSLWWLRRALAESHSAIHSGVNSSFFRGTASANLAAPLLSTEEQQPWDGRLLAVDKRHHGWRAVRAAPRVCHLLASRLVRKLVERLSQKDGRPAALAMQSPGARGCCACVPPPDVCFHVGERCVSSTLYALDALTGWRKRPSTSGLPTPALSAAARSSSDLSCEGGTKEAIFCSAATI